MSAQLVVFGHGISFCSIFLVLHRPNFPWVQNLAVLVFFVLSGFIISYSTAQRLRDGHYSFGMFFLERVTRIYTAYLPALLFILILDLVSQRLSPEGYRYGGALDLRTFFGNLLMLQEFPYQAAWLDRPIATLGSARPLWTLAVEWWIYLWFGFFVLVLARPRAGARGGAWGRLWQIPLFVALSIMPVYHLYRGNGVTNSWLFGAAVLMFWPMYGKLGLHKGMTLALLLGTLLVAALRVRLTMSEYDAVLGFLIAAMLMLVIELAKDVRFAGPASRGIQFSADFSLSLYLVHYSIFDFLVTHFSGAMNRYVLFALGFLISNVVAIALAYGTEMKYREVRTWMLRVMGKAPAPG